MRTGKQKLLVTGGMSVGGGSRPLWSRDGREIIYINRKNQLMRVEVTDGCRPLSLVVASGLLRHAHPPWTRLLHAGRRRTALGG